MTIISSDSMHTVSHYRPSLPYNIKSLHKSLTKPCMQPTYIIKVGLQDSKRLKQLNTRTMHALAHTSCIVKAASDFAAAPRGRKLLSITCMAFSIANSLTPSDSLISIPPCSKILGTYFVQFSATFLVASSPHIKQNSASTYESVHMHA